MADVREMLARLNPTTVKFDVGKGGGMPELTNIDIAGALGMVPAGLGRDLLVLLHGPDPTMAGLSAVFEGMCRMVMDESHRRMTALSEAKLAWGLAHSLATFHGDKAKETRRNNEILKARVAVARDMLWPDSLQERAPAIATIVIGYMKGERLSGREKAARLKFDESSYRERWHAIVEWAITQAVEAEQAAAAELKKALSRAA